MSKLDVVIITNIPSPYRVLQFDKLNAILKGSMKVIYFRRIEFNRKWIVPTLKHSGIFLKRNLFSRYNFHIEVFNLLFRLSPSVIVVTGFTPTVIFTMLYAKIACKRIIVFTDSWLHSVNRLKKYHKIIRRCLIPLADAYICVGKKGKDFLLNYGASNDSIFVSPLAIDNQYYRGFYNASHNRSYDFIISGQFIERKMPYFAVDVVKGVKDRGYNVRLLLMGSGPLEEDLLSKLNEYDINYSYVGFIQQEELPRFYADSKILLFPSEDDPWGLVANEACAVGTPVITCKNTGVSDDLIIHNYNGYVLPLLVDIWVEHAMKLLYDAELYSQYSQNALNRVSNYSVDNAALGVKSAIDYVNRR